MTPAFRPDRPEPMLIEWLSAGADILDEQTSRSLLPLSPRNDPLDKVGTQNQWK
jgi:hypothetical protein